MKKLYPFILIILGSILEIYYYYFRFNQDGVNIIISLIIAISLTAMLTILSAYYKRRISWAILIPLALFSIITTSSGQSFSLGIIEQEKAIDNVQQLNIQSEIDEIQADIKIINLEIEKNMSLNTLENTYWANKYRDELDNQEARQDELKLQKIALQDRIKELRLSQTQHIEIEVDDKTNIYKFYGNLFHINQGWLKFILQTILSTFIAVMAPIGIILLTPKPVKIPEPIKPPKKVKKKYNYGAYIEKFVNASFYPVINKRSEKIVDKTQYLAWMKNRYKKGKETFLFTTQIYDKIFKACVDNNYIDKNGVALNTNLKEIIKGLKSVV